MRNFFGSTLAKHKSLNAVKVKDIKRQMKVNWKIIEKYVDDPLSMDAAELQLCNGFLVRKLAMAAAYPCFD